MLGIYLDESLALLYCEIRKLSVLHTQPLDLERHHFTQYVSVFRCVHLFYVMNAQF